MSSHALVVGAGLSGLATAWYLSEAGVQVHVRDAAPAPGGLMRTRRTTEGLVETAARAFVWTERAAALFAAAGVAPLFAEDRSKRRFIYRRREPRRWPLGPIETANLAAHAGLAAIRGRLKPRGDETVEVWSRRVLGSAASRWLVGPALQGIYASPPDQLSAKAIFGGGRLRGRLAAPPGGMGELFDKLRAKLEARGATFEFGSPVVDLADPGPTRTPTAICTDAPAAAALLADHAPELAAAIATIRMTSLLSITAFYEPRREDVSGFGILFPRESGVEALGVLFNSEMFEDRSDARSETWIYGNTSGEAVARMQASTATILRRDRRTLTGRDTEPLATYPTSRIAQLPIYDAAILHAAAKLTELPPWLALCGNYLGKIGVSAILETAHAAAARLANLQNG